MGEAEIERLQTELANERDNAFKWQKAAMGCADKLAAAQAREAKLREVLRRIADCPGDNRLATAMRWAAEAITLPTDDTALRERLAAERERCAKVRDNNAWDYTRAGAEVSAEEIRALGDVYGADQTNPIAEG